MIKILYLEAKKDVASHTRLYKLFNQGSNIKKLKCKENIACFILNITMFKKKINMKSEDKLWVHSVTLLSLPMKSNAV